MILMIIIVILDTELVAPELFSAVFVPLLDHGYTLISYNLVISHIQIQQ